MPSSAKPASDTPSVARRLAELIGRMTRLGRLQPTDAIALAGPSSLDGLATLCRAGFDHGMCMGNDRCGCHAEPASALLIPHRLSDWMLGERLENAASCLAREATVVVRLRDVDQDRLVQERLEAAGLELRSTVFDMSRGVLVAHTVARRAPLRLAA